MKIQIFLLVKKLVVVFFIVATPALWAQTIHFPVSRSVGGSDISATINGPAAESAAAALNLLNTSAAAPLSYNVVWAPDGTASLTGITSVQTEQAISIGAGGTYEFLSGSVGVSQNSTTKFELQLIQNGDNQTVTIVLVWTITTIDSNLKAVQTSGRAVIGYLDRTKRGQITLPSPIYYNPVSPTPDLKYDFSLGGGTGSDGHWAIGDYSYETWDGTTLTVVNGHYKIWVFDPALARAGVRYAMR